MIADIKFLNVPGIHISQSVYPIFTAGYSDYVVETFTHVKCCKDLTQDITIPEFDDYDTCNLVAIGTEIYYVEGYRRATNVAGSVTFTVKYCAPTNLLDPDLGLSGIWERTPIPVGLVSEKIGNSVYELNSTGIDMEKLPTEMGVTDTIEGSDAERDVYWVEVTLSGSVTHFTGNTGITQEFTSGGIHRYGFFTYVNPTSLLKSGLVYNEHDSSSPYSVMAPALATILGLDHALFTATDIINISISDKCPYKCASTGSSFSHYVLKNSSNTVIEARATLGYFESTVTGKTYICGYHLDETDPNYADYRIVQEDEKTLTLTFDANLIDEYTTLYKFSLHKETGLICEIPIEAFTLTDSNYTLNVMYKTRSDNLGIYTYIKINNTTYTVPEGHLPFSQSAWESYVSLSLNYDRSMVALQNQQAEADAELSKAQGFTQALTNAGFGALGGLAGAGIGGATGLSSALINAIYTDRNTELTKAYNNEAQVLKEQQVKKQSASVYNTGYGLSYIWTIKEHPLKIKKWKMKDYTSVQLIKYHDVYGFPGNGFYSFDDLEEGYYKGIIHTQINFTGSGMKGDKLIEMFARGLRLKMIS